MVNIQCNTFNEVYANILYNLLYNGTITRTVTVRDQLCTEITPFCFTIRNPKMRLLHYPGIRNIKKYIFGELLWYMTGRNDVEFIKKYASMWERISDDGLTNNSAYGQYIFKPQPSLLSSLPVSPSQWDWVKKKLKQDPNTREAIIHIKPVQCYDTKDYVCTLTLSFYIRDNKLNMIVNMRSSDVYYGLPYDVFMFTFMQEMMAAELGVGVGTYTHFTNNVHFYEKDKAKLEGMYNKLDDYLEHLDTIACSDPQPLPDIHEGFRLWDVPRLMELEHMYWEDKEHCQEDKFWKINLEQLSPVGKALVPYLLGE